MPAPGVRSILERLPLLHEHVAHAAGLAPELDEPPEPALWNFFLRSS